MFLGHFGVALAGKRLARRVSLGTLILAAQFVDMLWPIFLLIGFEHVRITPGITRVQALDFYDYPYSHSLTMGVRWALALGLIYFFLRRNARGAWVLGALVLSHWGLDWIVHRPDLPLWIGGPKVGLGLWNSWPASISLELLMFGAGVWIYLTSTRPRDRRGTYAFWSLMALLLVGWMGATFGPPPPDTRIVALTALVMWIVAPWAWWADGHRELKGASSPT